MKPIIGVVALCVGLAFAAVPAVGQEANAATLGSMSVVASPPAELAALRDKTLGDFKIGIMAHVYNMSASDFGDYIIEFCDSYELIEGPRGNIALLWDLWTGGETSLPAVSPPSSEDLAGIFIGMAADPEKPVTLETVSLLATTIGVDPATLDLPVITSKAVKVQTSLARAKEEHG